MKTAVMTDTNSGILAAEAKKLGIFLVPMPFVINDEVYYEERSLSREDFFSHLIGGSSVTTSQPSPGDIMDEWDAVLRSGYDEIVYIPMSAGLSASYATAVSLAQDYDGKVQVVDNRRLSVTLKTSVLEAFCLAGNGAGAAAIRQQLENEKSGSSIYVVVDSLEYLKRGGRITGAAAALGSVLNLKPILTIQQEKVDSHAKVRGLKKARSKVIDAVREDLEVRFRQIPMERICLSAAGTLMVPEEAEEWSAQLNAAFPGMQVDYSALPLSLSCHVGPGSLGVGISILPPGMTREMIRSMI